MMTRQESFRRLMQKYGGTYGERALAAYATWELVSPWFAWAKDKYTEHQQETPSDTFTITVAGNDNIYYDLNEWVMEKMPPTDRKQLEVRTIRVEPYVKLAFGAETRSVDTYIDGHPVTVVRQEKTIQDPDAVIMSGGRKQIVSGSMPEIVFTAQSEAGRDAVIAFLAKLAEQIEKPFDIDDEDERPWMLTPISGGRWTYRSELPARPLTSVMLKNGQLERVISDMQAFLDNEEHYTRLSQPWHRGYLFYGPPGTGKTSMARALSDHFKLQMYWLSLGDVGKDMDLVNLISHIEKRSILLLEDIDAFDTATERDDDGGHASIAALLNALDGVWTPHGLITIMTTNKPRELDPALIRAGRIGLTEKFDYMDYDQVVAMAEYAGWMPENPYEFVDKSPADFMEIASRKILGMEDSDVDEILQGVLRSLD